MSTSYISPSSLPKLNWFSECLRLFPQVPVTPESILAVLKKASLTIAGRDPTARCIIMAGYMGLLGQMARTGLVDIVVDEITKAPFVRTTTLGEAVLWQLVEGRGTAGVSINEEGTLTTTHNCEELL